MVEPRHVGAAVSASALGATEAYFSPADSASVATAGVTTAMAGVASSASYAFGDGDIDFASDAVSRGVATAGLLATVVTTGVGDSIPTASSELESSGPAVSASRPGDRAAVAFGLNISAQTTSRGTPAAASTVTPVGFTNYTVPNGLGNNQVNGVYTVGTTVYAATAGGLSIRR